MPEIGKTVLLPFMPLWLMVSVRLEKVPFAWGWNFTTMSQKPLLPATGAPVQAVASTAKFVVSVMLALLTVSGPGPVFVNRTLAVVGPTCVTVPKSMKVGLTEPTEKFGLVM